MFVTETAFLTQLTDLLGMSYSDCLLISPAGTRAVFTERKDLFRIFVIDRYFSGGSEEISARYNWPRRKR